MYWTVKVKWAAINEDVNGAVSEVRARLMIRAVPVSCSS
ncbi:hypothetical protein GJA_1312 [Janthinobacterium agaricidamnosum NBRC 102515 = DSM 9628]|uniref:Uncharacterized protein n=1 Tax=Janthinobacterium agaricidamnosum NBRC 102515 = DSM 9628 TaxID=1349767 RepID=W0V318_9BURK|nr:hypothetical protein GJA_1312 [Janthinobacterium agaricidamnosum NBRC 102515 = DSM 9628]